MKSFSLVSAIALAAGVSAQYSAGSVSTPVPSSISALPASSAKPASSAPAPSSAPAGSVTTTITAKAGCPTGPAPDVIVTRSNAPVPSCAAGNNATKPSIMSMPGYGPPAQSGGAGSGMGGGSGSGSGNATRTGTGAPAQFTGAADKTAVSGALVVLGGVAAWFL